MIMTRLFPKRFVTKWARISLLAGICVFWSVYVLKDYGTNSTEWSQGSSSQYKFETMDKEESIANISTIQLFETALNPDNPVDSAIKLGLVRPVGLFDARTSQIHVHVVPFSHVDPGWLKQFAEYFDETNRMLDLAVDFMPKNPDMTFMWAEICFFQEWWHNKANDSQKAVMKELVSEGRFDILNGGWTMTDEASPHFWASVSNLVEGHQFLKSNLGMIPNVSLSIDPFGYGPTMPTLFQAAGIRNFVIGRVHTEIIETLRASKDLQFLWRQAHPFAADSLVHTLPYGHYDVPYSCGPSTEVCCQYDFRRLKQFQCSGPMPTAIDDQNVKEKASTLVDQLRQQAAGYQTNQVLFMLGDDFRYHDPVEWQDQYVNFRKLMEYTNGPDGKELNAELKFSTISRFFSSMQKESKDLITLKGDFFPYTDNGMDYWTGYFTTRPYYKKLDRIVQSQIRSANMFSSLALSSDKLTQQAKKALSIDIFQNLQRARRQLALFQHHDAITGTSKHAVMVDYGNRLLDALNLTTSVLAESLEILTSGSKSPLSTEAVLDPSGKYEPVIPGQSSQPIRMDPGKKYLIRVANAHVHDRRELVRLRLINDAINDVQLTDLAGNAMAMQIQPDFQFNWTHATIKQRFEIVFPVQLPPLSSMVYILTLKPSESRTSGSQTPDPQTTSQFAKVRCSVPSSIPEYFKHDQEWNPTKVVTLKSGQLSANFSQITGGLLEVEQGSSRMSLKSEFIHYNPSSGGAYIFRAEHLPEVYQDAAEQICVVEAPIVNEIHAYYPYAWQRSTLITASILQNGSSTNTFAAISVQNVVSIPSDRDNLELGLVYGTPIDNEGVFYTDSMGLQILKRKYQPRARVDMNYYPVASSVHVEDRQQRFTVLTGQPHGVTSRQKGQIELMLDRRLGYDDYRGMGETVQDNVPTISHFILLWEHLKQDYTPSRTGDMAGYLSPLATLLSGTLLNPLPVFFQESPDLAQTPVQNYIPNNLPTLPCDLDLMDLRSLDANGNYIMIFHRKGLTGKLTQIEPSNSSSSDSEFCPEASTDAIHLLLNMLNARSVKETSLTGAFDKPDQIALTSVPRRLGPMEFVTYKLEL